MHLQQLSKYLQRTTIPNWLVYRLTKGVAKEYKVPARQTRLITRNRTRASSRTRRKEAVQSWRRWECPHSAATSRDQLGYSLSRINPWATASSKWPNKKSIGVKPAKLLEWTLIPLPKVHLTMASIDPQWLPAQIRAPQQLASRRQGAILCDKA